MVISIDLGSNTIRFALVRYSDGVCSVLKKSEVIVSSARGLNTTGLISDYAKDKIYNALSDAKKEYDFDNVKHVAVATAAFRKARNSKDIFFEILNRFNIKFKLISGDLEARLTYLGVNNAVSLLKIDKRINILDLGGASTEISDGTNFKSFDFGILTFYEKFVHIDKMKEFATSITKEAAEFLKKLNGEVIVLTSGVPTTMVAFKHKMNYEDYNSSLINGSKLELSEFYYIMDKISSLDKQEAVKALGEDRQMLIVAGIILLKATLNGCKKNLIVIDDGLREGVAFGYFNGIV